MDNKPSYALIYEGGHDNAENFDEGATKFRILIRAKKGIKF